MPSIAYPNTLVAKQQWPIADNTALLALGTSGWFAFYVNQQFTYPWTYWGISLYSTGAGTLEIAESIPGSGWRPWPVIVTAATTPVNTIWRVTRSYYRVQYTDTSAAPSNYDMIIVFQNN